MNEQLDADVTRIAVARMGTRPPSLRVRVTRVRSGTERLEVLVLEHLTLQGTAYTSPGMPDAIAGGRLTKLGARRVADAVDDMARRLARSEARTRVRALPDILRPWTEDDRPPSWTLVSHPLMVHGLRRAGANDLPAVAGTTTEIMPGLAIRRIQDLLVGSCPLHAPDPARGRIFCDDMGLVLVLPGALPHVARTALLGRPLSSLIEPPSCGDESLDAVVAGLRIADVQDATLDDIPGVTVFLEPAAWKPCAAPPPRVDAAWLRMPPRIC